MDNEYIKKFLGEIEKDFGALPPDLHVTRKACALVAISDGKVIKLEEPQVHHCPLFTTLFNFENLDKGTIEKKFEKQCHEWGMFTCGRKVCDEKIIVPFGASEMIMYALKNKIIDCAVVACEGAGTVIAYNPGLVQGIGAYMNGLFYTTPIKEIINNIEENGGIVLSAKDAKLNQYEGIRLAASMGFKKIAVTVRGDELEIIKSIRDFEKGFNDAGSGFSKHESSEQKSSEHGGTEYESSEHEASEHESPGQESSRKESSKYESPEYKSPQNESSEHESQGKSPREDASKNITAELDIVILAICNTGISTKQALVVRDNADLAWACASKEIRSIVGPVSILQVGMKIPVFVMTEKGLNFISAYSSDESLREKLGDITKKHYITSSKFENGSAKIKMGKFHVFLYETSNLPVGTKDEPDPLI